MCDRCHDSMVAHRSEGDASDSAPQRMEPDVDDTSAPEADPAGSEGQAPEHDQQDLKLQEKMNAFRKRKAVLEKPEKLQSAEGDDGERGQETEAHEEDPREGSETSKAKMETGNKSSNPAEGLLKPLRNKIGLMEPRDERPKYKALLNKPVVLVGKRRDPIICRAILRGFVNANVRSYVIKVEKRIVSFLLSSTFTDTAWERNLLLEDVMPFLQNYARRRSFEIKLVEMRWGIREVASASHKTSEICMSELERCQRESQGFSYVFLGAQKYGFRPFPSKIPEAIYKKLHEACIHAPKTLCMEVDGKFQSHKWLLDQHYQIDTNVYVSESSTIMSPEEELEMEQKWEGPPGDYVSCGGGGGGGGALFATRNTRTCAN